MQKRGSIDIDQLPCFEVVVLTPWQVFYDEPTPRVKICAPGSATPEHDPMFIGSHDPMGFHYCYSLMQPLLRVVTSNAKKKQQNKTAKN